ncbi:glycosyltransferase [Amphibacillus sediminis]|uniref:glycosyltransferase n=1 Tax=Amphibacillus sediminis TaxID=360185 RepID=UPI000AC2AD0F|nr:glycosyltransferase [Amphibacillus sediminis]
MKYDDYSVLMSVYYKEKPEYLKSSIESMLNQTHKPNEIILVIDGPLTVELNELINIYTSSNTGLFTIVSLEENKGLGLALNEGIKVSRNELIARMDTDDIALPTRCETQVTAFNCDPELVVLGSHIDEFYDSPDNVVSSRIVPLTHEEIMSFSRRRNPFNHPTVMYKKTKVLEVGGYQDFRRNQDLDLFVRMLNNGCKGKNINESLLLFRANKDNFKRRKSWEKCKSYISMIYNFRKKGYSSLLDFLVVSASQIIIFISPIWVLELISDKLLRKKIRKG